MFKDSLRQLRTSRGYSMDELVKEYNNRFDAKMNKSTLSRYENGLQEPMYSTAANLAKLFGVSTDALIDDELPYPGIEPLPKTYLVPIIGTIACGQPITAIEEAEDTVEVPESVHADFALRCKGDSMINARIFNGDIVYIRKQETVENGEIAAVLIEEEATLKKVYLYPDRVILEPANPTYEPIIYREEEMNRVRILGKAVAFLSVIDRKAEASKGGMPT